MQRSTDDGHPAARFRVTDGRASVEVSYVGILPDLFREGQGVVALGTLQPDGTFRASEVLAKHDETYMPKEVADALKKSGHWNPAAGPPPPASTWNTMQVRKTGGYDPRTRPFRPGTGRGRSPARRRCCRCWGAHARDARLMRPRRHWRSAS